jgi:uncharacterized protein YecE (DUF72 family)
VPTAARVRIGLAGWSEAVSRHWSGVSVSGLDASASALARYAAVFDFVEINASFYRQFRAETYAKWAADVPPNFRFSVKMPRLITHFTQLKNVDLLQPFFASVAGLGRKLGAVLVQLPPSLAFDSVVAVKFWEALRACYTGAAFCEPRHDSWRKPASRSLLAAHHVGLVRTVVPETFTEDHSDVGPFYVRLHGVPRRYYSAYNPEQLAQLASFVSASKKRGGFVVFDNTASSAGVRNALELRRLVGTGV